MQAHDDLSLLIAAARNAGNIARQFFRGSAQRWEKPDGQGPVTEADLAVDKMLRETLLSARPQYGWLSEETEDDLARLHRDHVFIIDPIDGTRAFINGDTNWSHSLAISKNTEIQAAVVYLPMKDKLYTATKGQGAKLNGVPIQVSSIADLTEASVLAAKPSFEPRHWKDNQVPPVNQQFRSSLAYRLALVGEGCFDAMLSLRPTWEWDVAAGALIVQEAGGKVSDLGQNPAKFNNAQPQLSGIVAGPPALHKALYTKLA